MTSATDQLWQITPVVEDYLKAIYHLAQESGQARTVALAEAVKNASHPNL